MGHSQIGVVDPTTGTQAQVLTTAPSDTGQAGLAVRVVSGPSGGSGAATIADGADVAEGATSDAANTTGTTGTISGKLRGVVTLLAGILQVGGNAASGSTDSGNPVKVGARVLTTPASGLSTGNRVDLTTSASGAVYVTLIDSSGNPQGVSINLGNDAIGTGNRGLGVSSFGYLFNETTFDRQRANTTGALIAAGTASTQTNKAITNYNARSLAVILNVTVATVATLVLTITGTTASGYTYTILTGASLVTTGTTVYRVAPGLTAVTNLTASDLVPRNVLVTVTITGTVAYGVDYELSL